MVERKADALTLSALRQHATAILREGIAGAGAGTLVRRALDDERIRADLAGPAPVVVAAGKAAAGMAAAFADLIGPPLRGVIAAPQPGPPVEPLEWFDVGHPAPTANSVAAGRRALELAAGLGPDAQLVVLLSGGASAGLAVPIDGVTIADKATATQALLEGGVAIDGLNCVRKHLSAIKGGRLAVAAGGRCVTLAISDVVDPIPDDPAVIGSGPTVADPSTFVDAITYCRAASGRTPVPASVLGALERGARGEIAESPKPHSEPLSRASFHLIGSRQDAIKAAVEEARRRGFEVIVIDHPITGEARRAGDRFVKEVARVTHERQPPLCVVGAGETTVTVTGPGRGGRNQEFALASAFTLVRRFPRAVVASIGTDGIDGPTDAAGALVDTTTPERAVNAGLERPEHYLSANDAYTFFEGVGDLIWIGPTDTNVGDLQVALIA